MTVLNLACAVEMFHNCSLLLDDIEDGDEQRRGRSTVWTEFGTRAAIDAAWVSKVLSEKIFASSGQTMNGAAWLRVFELFTETELMMYEGQCQERTVYQGSNIETETYWGVVDAKTSALFRFCVVAPAMIAETNHEILSHLENFGIYLGRLHQVRDDLNEFYQCYANGEERKLHSAQSEATTKSILYVIASQRLSQSDFEYVKRALRGDHEGRTEVSKALSMIENCGAVTQAESFTVSYLEKCNDIIDKVTLPNHAAVLLKRITAYLALGRY